MKSKYYSYTFLIPAIIIYGGLFILPTVISFFFSMTWWTLTDWKFIGFDNFKTFFEEPNLSIGFRNTLIYAVATMGLKAILGFIIATFLTTPIKTRDFLRSIIFFPSLLSTVAIGATFTSLMHPTDGLINKFLALLGISGPDWLGDPKLALFSLILVDVWQGVGMATVIFIAGISSIPQQYYEALEIDGGNSLHKFFYITLPLSKPAWDSVIILALIGGLRRFDLIWTMTGGGPGFATDVIASIIYKQYASSFYGISTAGNVILLLLVAVIVFPLYRYFQKSEVEL